MKDETSIFIGDSVDLVSTNYYKLMLKTKRVFFEYLNQGKSIEEFEKYLDDTWGDIDHEYMKQRLKELNELVTKQNLEDNEIVNKEAQFEEIYKINSTAFYTVKEKYYSKDMLTYYEDRKKVLNKNLVSPEMYLTNFVQKYDNYQQNIPYYNKDGTVHSWHNISDYLSMVFNTDLTKSAWNTTSYDADLLDRDLLYLPAHPNACPKCIDSQGKVYSKSGRSKEYPPQQEAISRGVGHPNCKHVWTVYWDSSQIQDNKFNDSEWEKKYEIDQKKKALERQSLKFYNDAKIYKELGDYENYDRARLKYRGLRAKINQM